MQQGLEPGERVPNFVGRDVSGADRALYDRILGRPVLLWLRPQREWSAALAEVVRSVRQRCPELVSIALHAADDEVFLADDDDAQSDAPRTWDECFRIDAGLLEVLAPAPHSHILLTDANLRTRTVWRAVPRAAWLESEVARLASERTKGVHVRMQAPVLIIPGVLSIDECDMLIARYEAHGGTPSGMPSAHSSALVVDANRKVRHDLRLIGDQELSWLPMAIGRRLLPEVKQAFAYSPRSYESFKLVCYGQEGAGYFRPHRDNSYGDARSRRFAVTLQLNTGDYAGGGLRFPEYGDASYEANKGAAMVFSCALAHEVTEVTHGRRYAAITFLCD